MKFVTRPLLACAAGAALSLSLFCAAPFAADKTFTLTSPQLKDGGVMGMDQVFNAFGCTGKNVSPELVWSHPPKGTKSFAVTVYDPDAPTGSGWWHWVVSNIPADVRSLKLNASAGKSLPAGAVESVTDFGTPGYGGACPPPGDKPHRYVVTVYALDTADIGVTPQTLPAMAGFSRYGKVLGSASLTVTYGR